MKRKLSHIIVLTCAGIGIAHGLTTSNYPAMWWAITVILTRVELWALEGLRALDQAHAVLLQAQRDADSGKQ